MSTKWTKFQKKLRITLHRHKSELNHLAPTENESELGPSLD